MITVPWRPRVVRRALAGIALGATLAGGGMLVCGRANATPGSYIADLESSPWGFYGQKATYLAIGYGVCHRQEYGWGQADLIDWVVSVTGVGIYAPQAQYIVEAAEAHLCPGAGGRTA